MLNSIFLKEKKKLLENRENLTALSINHVDRCKDRLIRSVCKKTCPVLFSKLIPCVTPISSKRKYSRNREKFNILPTLITETQLHKYLIQRRISLVLPPLPPPPPFPLPVFSINSTRPEKNVETIIGFLHSHEDRIPFPVKICISKSWENEGTYLFQ